MSWSWWKSENGHPTHHTILESHGEELLRRLQARLAQYPNGKGSKNIQLRIDRVTAMLTAIKLGKP